MDKYPPLNVVDKYLNGMDLDTLLLLDEYLRTLGKSLTEFDEWRKNDTESM